jgi:CheY-like chemotaxis protein
VSEPLDADFRSSVALVIDGSPPSRRALVAMLRGFGVSRVEQAVRPQDALKMLEANSFDILICDFHFAGETMSGKELMDDLRQSGLLPLTTVVVMISGEANYAHVAEAAELGLDAYLIKPHTADALRVRLVKARERKRALAEIFALIGAELFEEAAVLAEAAADEHGVAWLQAARIGADLWLRLGRPADSARLLEEVLKTGALPWARLGLARAQTESGSVFQARRTLESLITDLPGYTDAYDVMGRVLLEQGLNVEAIEALRKASQITPNSVARLVKLGLMSFYFGDPTEAAQVLNRAVRLGASSKVFDLQGLTLLAALQYDNGDAHGLAVSVQSIERRREAAPGSVRLQRFETVGHIFKALLERRVGDAIELLRGQLSEVREPSFEFEAACNLLMTLSRVDSRELHLTDLPTFVTQLASRFAVSRTTTDLMCAALRSSADLAETIRAEYQRINQIARNAVERSVGGAPAAAAEMLLDAATLTLNAKLMDLATHTIDRHQQEIPNADLLRGRLAELHATYRSYGTQVRVARFDTAHPAQTEASPP